MVRQRDIEALRAVLEALAARLDRLETAPSQLVQAELDQLVRRKELELELVAIKAADVMNGDRLELLAKRLDTLTHAVAEGIERVDRSERRVRAVVKRAREELAEDGHVSDRLEAETHHLFGGDAPRGEEGRVPAVRPQVGDDPELTPGEAILAEYLRSHALPGSA